MLDSDPGGYRAVAATSHRHATRLAFQSRSALIGYERFVTGPGAFVTAPRSAKSGRAPSAAWLPLEAGALACGAGAWCPVRRVHWASGSGRCGGTGVSRRYGGI